MFNLSGKFNCSKEEYSNITTNHRIGISSNIILLVKLDILFHLHCDSTRFIYISEFRTMANPRSNLFTYKKTNSLFSNSFRVCQYFYAYYLYC